MATFRGYRFALFLTFLTSACGGSDEDTLSPPGPDADAVEEVSGDAEVDVEPDAGQDVEPDIEPDIEQDVEPDPALGPTQAVGGITSGGGGARSSRFVALSATTGGVLERRSERFVAVGRVAIPFFAE